MVTEAVPVPVIAAQLSAESRVAGQDMPAAMALRSSVVTSDCSSAYKLTVQRPPGWNCSAVCGEMTAAGSSVGADPPTGSHIETVVRGKVPGRCVAGSLGSSRKSVSATRTCRGPPRPSTIVTWSSVDRIRSADVTHGSAMRRSPMRAPSSRGAGQSPTPGSAGVVRT